jgi:exonuclease V
LAFGRYEWQADRSLLGQDEFDIEREWLDLRIGWHLEFWHGLREPAYVPEDETWKCRYCAFAELCPAVQALNLGNEPNKVDQNTESQKPQEDTVPKSGLLKYFKKDTVTQ